ncbi:ATP-binding protein [Delftia acidovorans]|uniref:ATP-binding protein n=1 Tax=Delftia acidovorans TaxID=80866 RepID=UPI00241E6B9D|nr:ATP-binding protein [Delftia acidovorans]
MTDQFQREREERIAAQMREQKQAEWRDRQSRFQLRSGLVGRMAESSFGSYQPMHPGQAEVLAACRHLAEHNDFRSGGGLWLIGPPGTGKTHLGSAMVNHVIRERDMGARILSSRQIVRMLRATWGSSGFQASAWDRPETESELIESLGGDALLVIDEVGASMGTEAERLQLFEVIDRRYALSRPTVLLSNLVPSDIKAAVGERSYDRLREGAKMLKCNWPSHRGGAVEC